MNVRIVKETAHRLLKKIVYSPSRVKYKIYIIDEVHMLSKSAFNALLKTLEEPPKHLIFILATTEPEKLPQTILSRCQRFDFKRITKKDIVLNMKNILKDIDIEIEDDVLNLIARNSDGAMRDALSLLEKCISFSKDKIEYEDAISVLGIVNKNLIFEFIENIKDKNLEKALMSIDGIIQNGKDIHQFIKDIIMHFRNLMVVKSSTNLSEILDVDDIDNFLAQSKSIDMDYILRALEIFTEADAQAKWSTQPRILLEMATIKLINIEEELSLLERIERLEKGIEPIKNITNAKTIETKPIEKVVDKKSSFNDVKKEPASPLKPAIVDDGNKLHIETIIEEWTNILQQIKSTRISVYALVVEGDLLSFENNLLTIGYKEGFGFHYQAISKEENKEFVEQIVSTYFNKNITVRFVLGDNKKQQNESKHNDRKEEAIKEVINFFGEDIVEIN